jgi:hypothetical protein
MYTYIFGTVIIFVSLCFKYQSCMLGCRLNRQSKYHAYIKESYQPLLSDNTKTKQIVIAYAYQNVWCHGNIVEIIFHECEYYSTKFP